MLERLSPQDLVALGFLALAIAFILVLFPCYLGFVTLTGCGPRRVQSICSYLLRKAKKRSTFSFDKIADCLYLGSLPRSLRDLEGLKKAGVGAMVTLNEPWEMELSNLYVKECGLKHLHLPTPDFFAPQQQQIQEAVQFITEHANRGVGVYVHCNGGRGRSAVCVICFLASYQGLEPEKAFDLVRSKRKIASMKGGLGLHKQWRAVKRFCRRLQRPPKRVEAFVEPPDSPDSPSSPSDPLPEPEKRDVQLEVCKEPGKDSPMACDTGSVLPQREVESPHMPLHAEERAAAFEEVKSSDDSSDEEPPLLE
ncbi:unnamed protein product [Effrenium voratum]|uniref:Uncharacterized protein n=1 Tax=Effrenium voratum TaxID=2562239 RepID=A0AA36I065_9DINO|nr:unnamed protein product [Effrenium voratum]CAJ1378529.1 unnamed protein product [Effrenium voratum]CAJ1440663.1 unnamed protein product [Effrenium voratum]|mmetsp:Transcript_74901/g.178799  ORF Transcript_74901/g.178799 Transcript_74901/m.178799 type:complete len:309 (+) Transcript_74901:80-1006(+)